MGGNIGVWPLWLTFVPRATLPDSNEDFSRKVGLHHNAWRMSPLDVRTVLGTLLRNDDQVGGIDLTWPQLGLARIAHRPSSGRGGWAEFQFTVQRLGSLPGAGKGMKMISRGIAPVVGDKSNIHSIFCLVRKICPKQGCGEPILIPMGLVRGRRMAFTMNVLLSPAACSERCSTPQHTLSRSLFLVGVFGLCAV